MSLSLFPTLPVSSVRWKCTRAVAAFSVVLAGSAFAQTTSPATSALEAPTSSAFKNFRPYTDEPVSNWKAANDEAARIGGWREYAKQSQETVNAPAPAVKVPDVSIRPSTKVTP